MAEIFTVKMNDDVVIEINDPEYDVFSAQQRQEDHLVETVNVGSTIGFRHLVRHTDRWVRVPNPQFVLYSTLCLDDETEDCLGEFLDFEVVSERVQTWPIAEAISYIEDRIRHIKYTEEKPLHLLPEMLIVAYKGQAAGATHLAWA